MSVIPSLSATARRWVLIGYWTGIFVLTHWPEIDRWTSGLGWKFPGLDKVVHFGLYAGWGVLWWWLLTGGARRLTRREMNWLIVGGIAYAVFDETTQTIVGRQPEVLDLLADVAGVAAACILLHLWSPARLAASPRRRP
jgi:hypothetical protein